MKSAFLIAALLLSALACEVRAAEDNKEAAAPASGASAGTTSVLAYLRGISGKFIVAGIHNREPNSRPDMQTERMRSFDGASAQ